MWWLLVAGCAASTGPGGEPLGLRERDEQAGAPVVTPEAPLALVGDLCEGASAAQGCRCRGPGTTAQTPPPAEGQKRFEIRMSAVGGRAILDLEARGRVEARGPGDRCFYVDLPAGDKTRFRFSAVADSEDAGVSPELAISEYGPAGPFWYDVLYVNCRGPMDRCNREGADAWKDSLKSRRRGRLDPCGSAVVTNLGWDTSGGLHDRDGGFFRDFTVNFAMEVKPFETQFAPGSTECVPK